VNSLALVYNDRNMAFLSLLCALSAAACGQVGVYALVKNPKENLNRIFFALAVSFSLAAVGNFFFFQAESVRDAWLAYYPSSFAWFFFPPLFLHFFILLTGSRGCTRSRILPVYLPGLVLYLVSLNGSAIIADFVRGPYGWKVVYNHSSPWYYLNILHYTSLPLISLFLLLRRWKRSDSPRERKQARVIFLTFILSFSSATVISTLLPLFSIGELPPMGTIFVAIWICGIGYAVQRYRLFALTPEFAASELVSKVDDVILLLDRNGFVLKANAKAELLSGVSADRLEGRPLSSLLASGRTVDEIDEKCRDEEFAVDGGSSVPLSVSLSPIAEPEGERIGYVFTGKDQRLTIALKASEEKFQKAFSLSPIGLAINRIPSGEFVEANDVLVKMLGYTRREILGKTDRELGLWEGCVEGSDAVRNSVAEKRGLSNLECRIRGKDGSHRTVLLSNELINLAGGEFLLTTALDLTERKALEKELIRVQKFESLAVLAGGIAHDFNNLLMIILGSLSLGKLYSPPENEELAEVMNDAELACCRARDLTLRLMSMARGLPVIRSSVDVVSIVRDAAAMAASEKKYVTEISIEPGEFVMDGDGVRLGQVFSNLLTNARQAMPDGGKIRIGVGKESVGPGRMPPGEGPLSLKPGVYIVVSVEDEGCGIPQGIVQSIFDPYFSTKAKGTGLGLSIVYSVLKSEGGAVFVRSDEGRGAKFSVYLPMNGGRTTDVDGKD